MSVYDILLADTVQDLTMAREQLLCAERLIAKLSTQADEMIKVLGRTVDLVEKLEIERNTWKFKAQEMEIERNGWQARAEEAEKLYRDLVGRATDLAAESGKSWCPECASDRCQVMPGEDTEYVLKCLACGYREEGDYE